MHNSSPESQQNREFSAVQLIDHTFQDGSRIVIMADTTYYPDDPVAYVATLTRQDGTVESLQITSAYSGVDTQRRQNRTIIFDDSSRIMIDIQKFEVYYYRGNQRELLIPA